MFTHSKSEAETNSLREKIFYLLANYLYPFAALQSARINQCVFVAICDKVSPKIEQLSG